MKTNFLKSMAVLATFALYLVPAFGQSPEKMSYQAVIRNASNNLVTSTAVAMQISILQGSASGTAVYVETQTPTTNANGLVSIEIGGGTVVSGNFTTIDWANGPYFVKTETDPDGATGGIAYTITGTSQLLSVPYALHAKTAESITGTITESQISDLQNYLTSEVDGSVTNEIQTLSVSGNDLTISGTGGNTITLPSADGSETKLTAGTNVTITGSGTTANPYVINASSGSATHYVGELYGGGIVFWVDQTGQHGLIVSMVDLSTSQVWSNITSTLIGTTNDWDGASNTTAITGQIGHTGSAAKLCEDYTNTDYGTGTYSDWYLPSIAELNHVWNNFYEVQKALTNDGNAATTPLVRNYYWSSSENNNLNAWYFSFNYGYTDFDSKVSTNYVRAVRAF